MLRGVLIFVVLVVFLLAQGPQAWSTAKSLLGLDRWDWWRSDPVTSPERAEELARKGLRDQLISFDDGMEGIAYRDGARADAQLYDIYAIGVSQVTLNEPESIEAPAAGLLSPEGIPNELPLVFAAQNQAIRGKFNNVLIFDRRTGEFTKLFDKRLAISEFQYGWRTTPEVLIVFAGERDTNKDGKLDSKDLQDIYVFTFGDKKLHKIAAAGINPIQIMSIPDVDYVVIKARRDRDKDGRTYGDYRDKDSRPEPAVLIRVDLKTMTASSFVPEEMLGDLQRTLDGTQLPETSEPKTP